MQWTASLNTDGHEDPRRWRSFIKHCTVFQRMPLKRSVWPLPAGKYGVVRLWWTLQLARKDEMSAEVGGPKRVKSNDRHSMTVEDNQSGVGKANRK